MRKIAKKDEETRRIAKKDEIVLLLVYIDKFSDGMYNAAGIRKGGETMSQQTVEQKLEELSDKQLDLQQQSADAIRLMQLQKELQAISQRCDEYEKEMAELEVLAGAIPASPEDEEARIIQQRSISNLHTIKQAATQLKKRQAELESEIASLSYVIKEGKNYDKSRTFKNIRALLAKSNVKLGQIEKEAGCQAGYMSRLEKNTTDPSVEFLVTAAKMLGVSIDTLIKGKIDERTPTEDFILEFLQRLAMSTNEDKTVWKRESEAMLKRTRVLDYDSGETEHPLIKWYRHDPYGDAVDVLAYETRFFKGEVVIPVGNSYHASLPDSDDYIYVMRCKKISPANDAEAAPFFEVYLINVLDMVNPLMCSLQTSEEVTAAIESLYQTIEISATHVHINDEARKTISSFIDHHIINS